MILETDIEKLLSGHWKSLTRTQQVEMAEELMTYRRMPSSGTVELVKRKHSLDELTELAQQMGEYS